MPTLFLLLLLLLVLIICGTLVALPRVQTGPVIRTNTLYNALTLRLRPAGLTTPLPVLPERMIRTQGMRKIKTAIINRDAARKVGTGKTHWCATTIRRLTGNTPGRSTTSKIHLRGTMDTTMDTVNGSRAEIIVTGQAKKRTQSPSSDSSRRSHCDTPSPERSH